ncbi:MAG: hypothetical protein LAO79_19600 [Acidobacteriia bacterium]|nr:hypothetical protein [Terriglobia bacterium]
MRRALAILWLALISFPLIGAAMSAGKFSETPACCRRGGLHQCEMAGASSAGGPAASPAKCPSWRNPSIAVLDLQTPAAAAAASSVHLSSYAGIQMVHDRSPRASLDSGVQKRGPPSLLD